MAKYNIRQPFAVHLEVVTDVVKPDGRKVRQRTQQSYFPGQAIEFTDDQALEHLHKLEPADPAAEKFLKGFNARQDEVRAAREDRDSSALDDRIAAAVADALAKAGIKSKAA